MQIPEKPISLPEEEKLSADFLEELRLHLQKNRTAISHAFLHDEDFREIKSLSFGQSDFHNHQKCTLVLDTGKGKFLYKPHSVMTDLFFNEAVRKFFPGSIRTPFCISGKDNGFCEFIPEEPAEDISAVKRFFFRLGFLCSFLHVLGSTDIHAENLIACGEYPVLIDLETILAPIPRPMNPFRAEVSDGSFLGDLRFSLMQSGIIPSAASASQNPLLASEGDVCCLPCLNGNRIPLPGHEADFFSGFRKGYEKCLQIRAELLQELDTLRDAPVRFIERNTALYERLRRTALSPQMLLSGMGKQWLTEKLEQTFIHNDAEKPEAIVRCETDSLLRGDIPYFYALGGGTDLMSEGQVIRSGFFCMSGIEQAKKRIRRLSQREMEFEIRLMEEGLYLSGKGSAPVPEASAPVRAEDDSSPAHLLPSEPLTAEKAVSEAEGILSSFRERLVESPSGRKSWFTLSPSLETEPALPGLTDGALGAAVFASAVSSVSHNSDVRMQADELVRISLEIFREKFSLFPGQHAQKEFLLPLGLDEGLGGILRALCLIRRISGNGICDEALDSALCFLPRIDFSGCRKTDILSGAAGLLQTLCRFPELSETEEGRTAAGRCADFLLEKQNLQFGDLNIWDTLGLGHGISGMGHGMAGIGCTLIGAGKMLKRKELTAAGLEAMEYEHRIYSESLQNWPDFRETAEVKWQMMGYCSGAPGIGLAVLSCIRCGMDTPDMREDLKRAAEKCLSFRMLTLHHLCCGNSARLEFLTEAYADTGEENLHEFLMHFAEKIVEAKSKTGRYIPAAPGISYIFSPSLFHGEPGIGYELLRIFFPDRLPSILI